MADIRKTVEISVKDKGVGKATKKIDKLNDVIDKNKVATNSATRAGANYDRFMKGNSQQSANMTKNFSKQAQSMQGVLVPAYAEVAARVFALTAAWNALTNAANFSILLKGQQAYAAQTGKDLASISRSIQKASKYMLDYKEAATSAALATTAGLTTTQINDMTEAALGASVALGRNMTDSMDRLTRGIVKAEPEILDELGIIIRLDNVYKDYADTLGVTTAQLSEFEKLQARTNTILDQAQTKYGDIAQAIDPNQFQVLSATLMDLGRTATTIVSAVLSPIAKFLADSEILLAGLMAVVTRNVLAKAIPAMKNFDVALKKIPQSLESMSNRLGAATEELQKKLTAKRIKLLDTNAMAEEFKKTIGTFAKLSPTVADAMAKGFKGKEFVDKISMAMRASIGHAMKRLKAGDTDFGGMLKGFDLKQVSAISGEWSRLVESTKQVSKEMRSVTALTMASWLTSLGRAASGAGAHLSTLVGSLIDFNASLYNITTEAGVSKALKALGYAFQEGHRDIFGFSLSLKKAKKELQNGYKPLKRYKLGLDGTRKQVSKTTTAFARFRLVGHLLTKSLMGLATIGISGVLSTMNMLVGLISAFSMASWALDWLGVGTEINNTKESLEELNTSYESLIKSAKQEVVFGLDFAGMKQAIDRDLNLSETLLENLKSTKKVDIEKAMEGWTSPIYEFFASAFGGGLSDAMGDTFAQSIQAHMALGVPLSDTMLKKLENVLNTTLFDKIRSGAELTKDDLEDLSNSIDNYIGTLGFGVKKDAKYIQDIQAGMSDSAEAFNQRLKETKQNYDAASEASTSFFKEQTDIGRAFEEETPFTQYANSFDNFVKRIEKLTSEARVKLLAQQGLLKGEDFKEYNWLTRLSKMQLQDINAAMAEGDTARKEMLQGMLDDTKSKLEELTATIDKELIKKHGTQKNALKILLGIDPEQMEKDFRQLENKTKQLTATSKTLKDLGVSPTSEIMLKTQESLIELEIKDLKNRRAILLLNKKTNEDQITQLNKSIKLKKDEFDQIRKNTNAIAEYNAEATGGVVTLSQKWANIFKDFGDSLGPEALKALETQRLHDFAKSANDILNSLYPLRQEAKTVAGNLDILNQHFGAGTEEAEKAIEAYLKLSTSLGKYKKSLKDSIFSAESDHFKSAAQYIGVYNELESDSTDYKILQLKAAQELEVSAKRRELTETHGASYAAARVAEMRASHKEINKWKKEEFKLARKIAKLENINSRRKAIKEEKANIELQEEFWKETSTLLELRQTIAKIENDYGKEGLDLKKQQLAQDEIMLAHAKLRLELAEAQRNESIEAAEAIADAYKEIAGTISEGFGQIFSDLVMGVEEEFDWRQTLGQSFADAGGQLITNLVDEQLTGRKGIVASFAEDFLSKDLMDAIFGKAPDSEQIKQDMNSLLNLAQNQGLKVRIAEGSAGTDNIAKAYLENREYNITPSNMAAGLTSDIDYTNMDWAQKQIHGGINPSVEQTLSSIDAHVAESQKFLTDLASKTLDSIDTLVSFDIGVPLEEAALDISLFVDTIDNKFVPVLDKLSPILDSLPTLITELTLTIKGVNDLFGFGKGDTAWYENILSSKEGTSKTSKEGQGPNISNISKIFEESSKFANSISPEAFTSASVVSLDPNFEAKRLANQEKLYQEFLDKKRIEDFVTKHHGEPGTLKRKLLGNTVSQVDSGKEKVIKGVFDQFDRLKSMDFSKITKLLGNITTFVSGMWPKDLADGTLFNTGFLGPGEIGPKTETQTFLESFQESGALKVLEQNPDAQKDATDASGGILVQNPTGDATALAVQSSLQDTLSSNLHSQIMNDNLNARALLTNSIASVGSNLMSEAVRSGISLLLPFANGGVAKGGFRAFANGGTVNSPTLGLVGEGRYNEAVVPLPDGKSIPVIGSTGGTNNVTVNVSVDSNGQASAQAEGQGNMQELGYQISQAVQEEIMRQQRPGGLLNTAGTRSY